MRTIQPTIYRQRVLPAKFTRQMLPAITADTTEIHKMIEEQYGKTVILPETQSFHVTNYNEDESKEMIKSLFSQSPTYVEPQPTLVQSSFYQPVLVTYQPYQPVIYNSINPNIMQRKNNLFQPILPRNIAFQQNPTLMNRSAPMLSSINLPYSSYTY